MLIKAVFYYASLILVALAVLSITNCATINCQEKEWQDHCSCNHNQVKCNLPISHGGRP